MQRDVLTIAKSKYAYIAPTYKQAKDIAWDLLKYYARPIPGVQFNEAELRVDYPNGSRIRLYGADNPDALRGLALWGVVFDEYSQQPSNIFSEIISPALADHGGYAIWIGTPKGKNDFYKLYDGHLQEEAWLTMMLKASQSKILSADELLVQRANMSEDEYNQEFECSFEASIKGAYYANEIAKARENKRITSVTYDPLLKVDTYWDLGMADSTAIGFFQVYRREKRMIDYYESSGEGLQHYFQVLQNKGYVFGTHYAPHDIQVRELGSGKSRLEIARTLGVNFKVVPNLSVQDGINAARMIWPTMWVDDQRCGFFLDAVSQYRKEWDDKNGCFKDKPLHDWTSHAADVLRYFAVSARETASFSSERIPDKHRRRKQDTGYSMRMV